LPPCPAPQDLAALGTGSEQGDGALSVPRVIVDRAANRAVATSLLRILKCANVEIIDAGLASTGSRLDVATALSRAGVPRPESLIAFSEHSGIDAAAALGFPATLLPMTSGSECTTLLDSDTADAVIEHRIVLGSESEAVVLIQAGAPARVRIHIVDGVAIAFDGDNPSPEAIDLAQRAARVIDAQFVAIDVASVGGKAVIWDVVPVADFRKSTVLGETSIGEAVASLAMKRACAVSMQSGWEGAHHAIALTA
jgi:glutathione synthase/RimK-type ligase-like ATP-grasp enzyme